MNRLLVIYFLMYITNIFSQSINDENQGVKEFEIDCSIRALEVENDSTCWFVGSNNKPGYFKQQLEVYGRQGEECKLCSSVLKSLIIGQRSSVYCPKCQN